MTYLLFVNKHISFTHKVSIHFQVNIEIVDTIWKYEKEGCKIAKNRPFLAC